MHVLKLITVCIHVPVTIVLWAPDTAGPWSAVIIKHISMNLHAYAGRRRLNLCMVMTHERTVVAVVVVVVVVVA